MEVEGKPVEEDIVMKEQKKKKKKKSKKSNRRRRARDWCFTSFKEEKPIFDEKAMLYIVYQREESPETKKLHYQGYVEMKYQVTMKRLKKILKDDTIHLSIRMGKREEARKYCMKEDTRKEGPWEEGKWVDKNPGRRTDIIEAKAMMDKGASYDMVNDEYPSICAKYPRYVDRSIDSKRYKDLPTKRKVEVIVYYGEPGVGKTGRVYYEEKEEDVYPLENPGKKNLWFDGYEGQSVLLIDDFDGWMELSLLKHILDIYKRKYQVKGNFVTGCWKKVYITANVHPSLWFRCSDVDYRALERRFTRVEEIREENDILKAMLNIPLI